jgi:hypothetical protein
VHLLVKKFESHQHARYNNKKNCYMSFRLGLKRGIILQKIFKLKWKLRLEWNILLKILLKTWPVLLPTAAYFKTFFRPGTSPFINFNRNTGIILSKLLHRKYIRTLRGIYFIQSTIFYKSFGYIYYNSVRFGNHHFELSVLVKNDTSL